MSDLIADHIDWCRAAGMTDRTYTDRERVLRKAERTLPLGIEEASEGELTAYLGQARWSPSTRSTYFSHLFGFYVWADGVHLDINPMSRLRRPRAPRGTPRPIPREQLDLILGSGNKLMRFCALVAAKQGLRCKEIAGLRRRDVTQEWTYIQSAKGGAVERVPTDAEVWREVNGYPDGLIVEHLGGRANAHWISSNASNYLRRVLHIGGGGVALHSCRHWYATELRKAGHDLFMVQRLMRHKSIQSTQGYVDVTDEERRLAVGSLPALTPSTHQGN